MTDERTLNQSDLKKMKVLIVDPNAFMRGVVADSLRRLMVTNINAAASAMEAFTVGRTFKPDIVFVDWDAGRMSGLEFTREVRRNAGCGEGRPWPRHRPSRQIRHHGHRCLRTRYRNRRPDGSQRRAGEAQGEVRSVALDA